ncbi:hypothetical protein AB0P12_01785, partial [Streptomyces subrutilus]
MDRRIDGVTADVGRSVDEVRAVMRAAGYADASYRIVLPSSPSPIPRGAEDRHPQSDWTRLDTGGRPFWNRDPDWARDALVPQRANRLGAVARPSRPPPPSAAATPRARTGRARTSRRLPHPETAVRTPHP